MNASKTHTQVSTVAPDDAATRKVFLPNPPHEQEPLEDLFNELVTNHSKTLEYLAK